MTYKKPTNIRYTDMAIWIDAHAYEQDCDDILMFEYIYHLINMLAHQASYFKTAQHYDDFSLNGATRVFLRLKNKKQFEYDEATGQTKLPRVKSVLNYIKSIIYPMKVVWEQENYSQVSPPPQEELSGIEFCVSDAMRDAVDAMHTTDVKLYLRDIPRTCRAFVCTLPHKANSAEWHNIYLSCMLSLLNSVTINNKNKERIGQMADVINNKPKLFNKVYEVERNDCVILYHLDESMHDYIQVIVNRLRRILAKDLTYDGGFIRAREIGAQNLFMSSTEDEIGDEQ